MSNVVDAGNNRYGIIYRATSKTTKKSYIGQTLNAFSIRKRQHRRDALEEMIDYKFYRAIRKYGWEDFEWAIIYERVPINFLNHMEVLCIELYNTFMGGYNSDSGGSKDKIVSDETKEKIRKANIGKHCSDETKEKLSIYNKGKHLSIETRMKMCQNRQGSGHPRFGKHHSDEAKQKISNANKGSKSGRFGAHLSTEDKEHLAKFHTPF